MDEVIKATVQAHCLILAPKWGDSHIISQGVNLWRYFEEHGWQIDRTSPSGSVYTICRIETKLPADNNQWWIAAKLLDIPTEPNGIIINPETSTFRVEGKPIPNL